MLPRAHAQGVKQLVCLSVVAVVVVVIGTKIAIFCSMCLWFINHTHSFSMLMRLCMLKLSVGKGRQVIKQLCEVNYAAECCSTIIYAKVATERVGYVLYRALVYFMQIATDNDVTSMLL